jgi:predicted O-methyltransferase YrrM
MEMTPQRWEKTNAYLAQVFGREDAFLADLSRRAEAAGLPPIAISPDEGRLLSILAGLAGPDGGGARLAVEVGTLAGYSGVWIARGLAPGGRLITIESEPKHADFARDSFNRAGLGARVDVRLGKALDVLPGLAAELVRAHGPTPVDLVFLDAVKYEYAEYFRLLRSLIRPGGLVLADNALGSNSWWIDEPRPGTATEHGRDRDGVDQLNQLVAGDAGFEAACIPIRQGLLIARRAAEPTRK